jgi:hypothetical protein
MPYTALPLAPEVPKTCKEKVGDCAKQMADD